MRHKFAQNNMKYYIIAGEASGDLHASNVVRELRQIDPDCSIRAWGGDLMSAAGAEVVKHYRDLAFMGFVEVALNIRTIWKNLKFCQQDLQSFQPDALILVDYPGFNLRIAEFAHQQGYRVIYYISPQVWAWHRSRITQMRRVIDHLLVILPFEKAFLAEQGMEQVTYVGHPLLDSVAQKQNQLRTITPHQLGLPADRPLIALLPGSRRQEIITQLPIMLSVVRAFPQYCFVVAATEQLPADLYYQYLPPHNPNVQIVYNRTYEVLHLAEAALVTSGTATLETALLDVPQVVCYRANWLSYQIAKRLVDLQFISLVNLIMNQETVTELIQDDLNTEQLTHALQQIIVGGEGREAVFTAYSQLRERLGTIGAARRVAEKIVTLVSEKSLTKMN